jgi:ATP-binding cassette subfamily C protein CydCD
VLSTPVRPRRCVKTRPAPTQALLADPEVLVLDEPTAHLDTETEREVLADLLDGTRGQTVLLSTHRGTDRVDRVVDLAAPAELPAQVRLISAP